jgi:Putative homoserine kinase type II (protein kinase fold)
MSDSCCIRYSQFSDAYIGKIISENYDIANISSNRFFRLGMNDIYLISAGDKKYFFRISLADVYKQEDYEQEAAAINVFHAHGIGVACPVICQNGGYVLSLTAPEGKRYAILFEEAINNPGSDHIANLYNLGRTAAELHMVSDDCIAAPTRPPIDLVQLIDKPLAFLSEHTPVRPEDYTFIKESEESIAKFINSTLSKQAPFYGFCHGDLHLSNVFLNGDKPTLFDFDCMGSGWRVHDIAVFLFNQSFSDNNYRDGDGWKSFLNGYNSIRPLVEAEIKAIPAFCALRSIWVVGVHTDLSHRNIGCQMFSEGYFNFFINNFKFWYNIFIAQ